MSRLEQKHGWTGAKLFRLIHAGEHWILTITGLRIMFYIYPRWLGWGYNCGRGFCVVDGFAFGWIVALWPCKHNAALRADDSMRDE